MTRTVTLNTSSCRDDWLLQLSDTITSLNELLTLLELNTNENLLAGRKAKNLFPLRVPRSFVSRIKKGQPNDPLLKQILPVKEEFNIVCGFNSDPLKEEDSIVVPGLLHKYYNRALLLVKGGCAINCRYCFRRHFPYHKHKGNKRNWKIALDYIAVHPELNEIIFSGGDPLMAKDDELNWLISYLEKIPHISRLRIHSRLPIVIPERITDTLISIFARSRQKILLVNHINHANEINESFRMTMTTLKRAGVTLLNQSVLLRGVNDDAQTLANLSNALFDSGIVPYYLHILDKVQGAAHFMVSDGEARQIMRKLMQMTSGYMVPKLVRETGGKLSKIIINL